MEFSQFVITPAFVRFIRLKLRIINKSKIEKQFVNFDSLKLVDSVIAITEYMREVLLGNRPRLGDKIRLLPRQVRRRTYGRPKKGDHTLHLAYSSPAAPGKKLHIALEALGLLPRTWLPNFL